MGIGVSLFLIAVGAILSFAVNPTTMDTHGIDVDTVGVILMVVGVVGLLLTLFIFDSWRTMSVGRRHTTVHRVDDEL